MSVFLDYADALAEMLGEVSELDGITIIVERQQDVPSLVASAIAKHSSGQGALVVTWAGGTVPDPDYSPPRLLSSFNVTLFSKPVIRSGQRTAEEIIEATMRAIHRWSPTADGADTCYEEAVTTGVNLVPTELNMLIHQISVEVTNQIQSAT